MADNRSEFKFVRVEDSNQEVHKIAPSMLKKMKRKNPADDDGKKPVGGPYRIPRALPKRDEKKWMDIKDTVITIKIFRDELNRPTIINHRIKSGIKKLEAGSGSYTQCRYVLVNQNGKLTANHSLLALYEASLFKIVDCASTNKTKVAEIAQFQRNLNLYPLGLGEFTSQKINISIVANEESQEALAKITMENQEDKIKCILNVNNHVGYSLQKSTLLFRSLILKFKVKDYTDKKKVLLTIEGQKQLVHEIDERHTRTYIHGSSASDQRKEEEAMVLQLKSFNQTVSSKFIPEADGVFVRGIAKHTDLKTVKYEYAVRSSVESNNNNTMEATSTKKKLEWKKCADVTMNGDYADTAMVTKVETVMPHLPTTTLSDVVEMQLQGNSDSSDSVPLGVYKKLNSGAGIGELFLGENLDKDTAKETYPNFFKRYKCATQDTTPLVAAVVPPNGEDLTSPANAPVAPLQPIGESPTTNIMDQPDTPPNSDESATPIDESPVRVQGSASRLFTLVSPGGTSRTKHVTQSEEQLLRFLFQ